jgi:GNAT superfamily N-acetyltransferase
VSARLHLCGPEDLERLLPIVAAFHHEAGIAQEDAARRAALTPLLDGSPHGALYLIGPARAPVGYLACGFTWSIAAGGLEAILGELWIRPAVRGRGMAAEALAALAGSLAGAGVVAMSLQAAEGSAAERLFARLGFARRDRHSVMSRRLA